MATSTTSAGYFRLGTVILQIPPTDIQTNRVVNDDQLATIRGQGPMFIKSGQARWDVTIQWKALRLVTADGSYDYAQWQDLRTVVAMFKASPFVDVENAFLRQHFTNIHTAYQSNRMAFAMKQLRIDTNPDSTNILDVTLTISLFNYTPYSPTFAFKDNNNNPADADNSPIYNAYLGQWIASNMDSTPHAAGEPNILPWQQQNEGDVSFIWRKYVYAPFDTPPPQAVSRATTSQSGTSKANYNQITPPVTTVAPKNNSSALPAAIQAIVNTAATLFNLDPTIITAQCIVESGGNPKAKATGSTASGLFQLTAAVARQLGVTDVFDPTQNAQGACKFMATLLKQFGGSYSQALAAYNAGPATVSAYAKGTSIHTNLGLINPTGIKSATGLPPAGVPVPSANAPAYVTKILNLAGKPNLITSVPPTGQNNAPPPQPTDSSVLDIPNQGIIDKVNAAMHNLPPADPDSFWQLDHYSEQGAYFFQEETLNFAGVDSAAEGDFPMYPTQLSIVMVNNLAMIPLAGMQYPTYQHVGPADTMVSIAFTSVGDEVDTELNEPQHDGIVAVTQMSQIMENQFHDLRTHFRAISSIHRMQAVFVQNQIMNMLGIRGTMLRGLNTETVPDSSNEAQVSIMCSQYENIFEETLPFRINGAAGAYKSNFQTFLKSGALQSATQEEQNAYQVLQQFSTAWKNHDQAFLLSEILSISKQKIDVLGTMSLPTINLRPDQQEFLLAAMDFPQGGTAQGNSATSVIGSTTAALAAVANTALTGKVTFERDIYPGLQIRRAAFSGSSTVPMTYADWFVYSQLPTVSGLDQTTFQAIKTQVNNTVKSNQSQYIETMYQKLFDFEMLTNPLFSRQATAIANSPAFKNQFGGQITVDGPALQNPGHYCYKDLGLTQSYQQQPGMYFFDYNDVLNNTMVSGLQKIIASSTSGANAVNNQLTAQSQQALASGNTARASQLNAFGTTGFVFSGGNEGIDPTKQALPGGADALSRMMNVPAFSMNSAFPTFKLMLLEEDNTGPFFAFDNFYSYATVLDIEIIKYADKPDTAIIQITDLAHSLQHRIFDDTAAGKLEKSADKFNIAPNGDIVLGGTGAGEVGTGGGGGAIVAGKTAAGQPYQLRKNYTEGRGETYSRMPLKFYALQTGAKIQVRMGYDNNPDNLFPVFTGQVTEIEGNDILTITCQSFQLELMNVPGTSVIANSRWGLTFLNSGGAAMGGWSLSNAGDTASVIEKMLTAENARHFGHWQIGGQVDPMLKGFQWSALLGTTLSAASSSTLQTLGALLQTGYDRSGENILVNSTISFDASKTTLDPANQGRRTFDEETSWLQSFLSIGTASYSIPKQSELSVWDIAKDVSRRYPHFNLLVKDYGFPYGADGTMVYAHPLDWYYSRPPLFGEDEKETANDATQGDLFQQWWNSVGHAKWDDIWNNATFKSTLSNPDTTTLQQLAGAPLQVGLTELRQPLTQQAGTGPTAFVIAIQEIHGLLTGTLTGIPGIPSVVQNFSNIFTGLLVSGNITRGFFQNLDANFQALLRAWEAYLAQSSPAANSSRIRPVRKYHMIDHNHIVHNGMAINDKIYNAVKIMDETPYKFNQNIPGQHLRVLNVTEMINDPEHNCATQQMKRVYAQSFLREEVGKMYRGELVLRGVPEIEPMDIVLINDPSTGIIGPVEVESVIHSFNIDQGYITIVKPRCWVICNESVSMNLTRALGFAWANSFAEVNNLGAVFNPTGPFATGSGTILAGGAIAGATTAAIAIGVFAPPLGLMLAGLALLAGYGILTYVESQQMLNFFKLQPLSRFGRPWIGGLQGFKISDFAYSVLQGLQYFDAEEIAPTIESWDELINYRADYIQGV